MVRITDSNVQDFEKKHIAAVRDMAAECAVLLKSNGEFSCWRSAGKGLLLFWKTGARNTIKGRNRIRRCERTSLCLGGGRIGERRL